MKFRILVLIPGLAILGMSVGCIVPVHERGHEHEREHDRGRHEGEREHEHERDHGPSLPQ